MHAALLSGDQQDQLVIAYNLIMDNKRLADETEKLQILDFFVASSPPVESFMMVRCEGVWMCVSGGLLCGFLWRWVFFRCMCAVVVVNSLYGRSAVKP